MRATVSSEARLWSSLNVEFSAVLDELTDKFRRGTKK